MVCIRYSVGAPPAIKRYNLHAELFYGIGNNKEGAEHNQESLAFKTPQTDPK